jgi:MFS family permease
VVIVMLSSSRFAAGLDYARTRRIICDARGSPAAWRHGDVLKRAGRAIRHLAVDISPLRESRDFRLMWSGELVSLVGRQVTVVAVPFSMFELTHSSVAVGLIGVVQLVPYIALSLVGGIIADAVDRRRLLVVTQAMLAVGSAVLAAAAFFGFTSIWLLYVMAAVISAVSAVDLPAQSAIVPNLVRRQHLAPALSLGFAQFQASLVVGPALGGVVIAALGLPAAYAIDVLSFGAAIGTLLAISAQPVVKRTEAPLRSMIEGFRYVRKQGAITGGFAIDLNAMIFGMPRALFPALAAGTYHAGPQGLGLLYAAPGVGAVIGSLLSGFVGRIRHQGRAVVIAAAGWAAAIALFGLTTFSLGLGLVFLAVAGASDIISAVARNTILQTTTPDRLRGRASAANSMVVVGGPFIGDVRAGTLGQLLSPQYSIVGGAVVCLALCAVLARAFPALWRYHADVGELTAPDRGAVEREPV